MNSTQLAKRFHLFAEWFARNGRSDGHFPNGTIFAVETPGACHHYRHYRINYGVSHRLGKTYRESLGAKAGWVVFDRNLLTRPRLDGAMDGMHYAGPVADMQAQLVISSLSNLDTKTHERP